MSNYLVISLDVEKLWGFNDFSELSDEIIVRCTKVDEVITRTSELFNKYNIVATWAIVGALIDDNLDNKSFDFLNNKPLGSYSIAPTTLSNLIDDGHEIATHTYSHSYYEDSDSNAILDDVARVNNVHSEQVHDVPKTIIFPRNQVNDNVLKKLAGSSIGCYRGEFPSKKYTERMSDSVSLFKRVYRVLDSYINLSGYHLVKKEVKHGLVNIPASRFLRFDHKFEFLRVMHLNRVKSEISALSNSKENEIYHLWWHPHNLAKDLDSSLSMLEDILNHFSEVKGGKIINLTMSELSK